MGDTKDDKRLTITTICPLVLQRRSVSKKSTTKMVYHANESLHLRASVHFEYILMISRSL